MKTSPEQINTMHDLIMFGVNTKGPYLLKVGNALTCADCRAVDSMIASLDYDFKVPLAYVELDDCDTELVSMLSAEYIPFFRMISVVVDSDAEGQFYDVDYCASLIGNQPTEALEGLIQDHLDNYVRSEESRLNLTEG
ncbi:MAG: hypothetical protein HRT61_21445 [Ekhidna sp.]|nr:hypothetical protein [Ekhidna sp.]